MYATDSNAKPWSNNGDEVTHPVPEERFCCKRSNSTKT